MSDRPKYVFFGTPRFAEIILGRLIDAGMPPIALVCNPDRPFGRKKVVAPPPAKRRALEARAARIAVFQPEKPDEELMRRLKPLKADLFVVAAYAKILPRDVVNLPRLGTLGAHPSLLPAYRGASPIQSAILRGEHETGASIYRMDEKMDHGPIFAEGRCDAGGGMTSYPELEEKLAELSAKLLIETMPKLLKGALEPRAQDESEATYTKKFTSGDGFVAEADLAAAERGDAEFAGGILRKINALNPEPGAWTTQTGRRVKLLGAVIAPDGALRLTKTQAEGERPRRL